MSASRLYVPTLAVGALRLDAATSHYLVDVRRLRAGDSVELFDGRGGVATARLAEARRAGCTLRVEQLRYEPPSTAPLTLAVAAPKGERADWLVEKATELGVNQIVWITTERSVVKPPSGGQRLARWLRLAQAAARQVGRSDVPALAGPVPFAAFLDEPFAERFLADPAGTPLQTNASGGGPVVVAIGPEGGFAPTEVAAAERAGYRRLRLAEHVLRVETAALVAVARLRQWALPEPGSPR